jgi:SagB-type dehydrogenase family enzyme
VDARWFLSLPETTTVTTGTEGELHLSSPAARMKLRQLTPGICAALKRLAFPGEQAGLLAPSGHGSVLANWYWHLQNLARQGWLLMSVRENQAPLATLQPISASFLLLTSRANFAGRWILSRFAYLRQHGGAMVLESPRSFARCILHDARAVALVHALAGPIEAAESSSRVPGLCAEFAEQLLGLLLAAGVVVEMRSEGTTPEDTDAALSCWEFHDLLFHSRSRQGRHDMPVGGTYRFAGQFDTPPAVKPAPPGDAIALYRPDLAQLQRDDPPFAEVQERRRSLREYADTPIAVQQLGEFLFRVARIKTFRQWEVPTSTGQLRMQGTARPYPAGGGLYELETYVLVNRCQDLNAGLYYYDALDHTLRHIATRNPDIELLLVDAATSAGVSSSNLQVVLILASRLPRLAWKYASLAYALTLKDVGALFQTMYLAATAMGLAPCALGGGNSDLFVRAAALDYFAETSVGEFLLGSMP